MKRAIVLLCAVVSVVALVAIWTLARSIAVTPAERKCKTEAEQMNYFLYGPKGVPPK